MATYLEGKDIINITVKGSIEAEFASASLKVNIKTQGKTGPDAKTKANPIIEKVKNVVKEYAERAAIEADRLKTTLKTAPYYRSHSQEYDGYQCEYTLSFSAKNLTEVVAVHDALTSIEGATAESPVFHVNNTEEVQARAFEAAVKLAQARFESQCTALGLPPQSFQVTAWATQDSEEHHGKFMALDREKDAHISLSPGKARYESRTTFWYTRRPA